MTTVTGDYSSNVVPGELDAWKEVHATLTEAVKRAQDAVHAQKNQRRFWLEEICANLTGEGKLKPTSVWKRPVVQKKSAVKKPSVPKTAGAKRKKKDPDTNLKPAKKPRKKKAANNEGEPDAPKPKKIKISLKKKAAVPEAFLRQPEEDLDESETYSNDSSGMQEGEYALAPPPPGPHWGAPPAHNPLQMMVRILMLLRYLSSNKVIVVFFSLINSNSTHSTAKCRLRLLSVPIQQPFLHP